MAPLEQTISPGSGDFFQDLYQFVFIHRGGMPCPFKLYKAAPRCEVTCSQMEVGMADIGNSVLRAEIQEEGKGRMEPLCWSEVC